MFTLNSHLSKTLINCLFMIGATHLIGCDQPSYELHDNVNTELSFGTKLSSLSAYYLTNSTVTFTVNRTSGEGAEGLEIRVSDEALLKPLVTGEGVSLVEPLIEEGCVGSGCEPSDPLNGQEEGLSKTFAVMATGAVTITVLDQGELVASERVSLVNATRITTSLEEEGSAEDSAAQPLIAVNGRHRVEVKAHIEVDGEEQALSVGGLIEAPSIEGGVSLSRSAWGKHLVLQFEPTQEGSNAASLKLGGQDVRVELDAVGLDEIADLQITNAERGTSTELDENGEERVVNLHQSTLSVLNEQEVEILGAIATWTAVDHPELSPISASRLVYEYSETERVTFEVKVGELVKEVTLPMNPQSSVFFGESIDSCDQASAKALPSLLLLMLSVIYTVRRQAVA